MRVVHCITGLRGDGAQRMVLRLTEGLQRRGIDNVIVSLSPREPLADAFEARGMTVHSLGMCPSVTGTLNLAYLPKLLDDLSPDLLQGWMYHANLMLTLVSPLSRRKVPVLWNIRRGTDDIRERKFSTRAVIRANSWLSSRAEHVVYCTHESRRQHQAIGFSRHNGFVIGNGFDVGKFSRSADMRRTTREKYGVADTDILIGNIGRDDSAKGRPYLIEAFAGVLKQVPNARLLLVGRGMSKENPELLRLLASAGVTSRVTLVGEYSPISDLYSAIDILCSSSVTEGFPNVIGEAMSCEVPCVASDVGNVRELLDGVGVIVPPRSAKSLADALIGVSGEGRKAWRERGVRSRHRISDEYSMQSVVDAYASLYRDVVGRTLLPTTGVAVTDGNSTNSAMRHGL